MSLERLFNPKSVAVVGASNKVGSVGNGVMRNILGKFPGIVYPVNRKRDSVLGVKAYPSVSDIKDDLDLVVIATPNFTVPSIIKECGKKKVGGIVVITAGFKEAGSEGQKMYQEIIDLGKKHNIRIIGPNCLGFLRPKNMLNASFAAKMALPGRIALLSQSGALCTAILDWSVQYNVGFSHFVSLGSMADVGFKEMIEYLEDDEETDAIIVYMESLSKPDEFLKAAESFSKKKPIIVLKVGRSDEGAKAAMSHTGSLAGNDAVFDAAFERAGIVRVENSQELYDCAQVLSRHKPPKGNRLAIVTNAGGPGVIATDALISKGGKIASLEKKTVGKLNKILPPHWSHGNPVDVLGDADETRYKLAVEECIKDKNVDGVLVILTPQSMTKPAEIAKSLVSISKKYSKPIFASWMGEEDVELGRRSLERGNIPVYRVPENAIKVFLTLHKYSKERDALKKNVKYVHTPHSGLRKNMKIINQVYKEKRLALTEYEAKDFMSNYGIPCANYGVAKSSKEAASLGSKIGFPVVMKIASPDILHKTDVGGVRIGVNSEEEAAKVYTEIVKSSKKHVPKAKIAGVLVEEMVHKKFELLIGSKKDDIFGPTVVFGMGGTTVELFKDTNLTLPPLNRKNVKSLMEMTKVYSLLKGYRGQKGVSIKKVEEVLFNFSTMLIDFPQLAEVDINPFSIDSEGGVVLDAKIILDSKYLTEKVKDKYEHLVIKPL